jgi:acyl-CoA thioesterase
VSQDAQDPTAQDPRAQDLAAQDPAAQKLASRCAEVMWAGDSASRSLGMTILEVGPGRAVLQMPVRSDMVNGHGIGHGGLTFTLADSAFAFACNSYNRRTVAQRCEVTFLAPTRLGDVLTAEALERSREGRDGVYDVTVRVGDSVVASFVGHSKEIRGALFDEGEG